MYKALNQIVFKALLKFKNKVINIWININVNYFQFEALFKAAQQHLDKGQAQFEAANDGPNLALLQSNHGRLMRLLAHYNHPLERKDISPVEKQYYNKVLYIYLKCFK